MKLILSLRADDDDDLSNFKLHVFAYVGMQLREAAPLELSWLSEEKLPTVLQQYVPFPGFLSFTKPYGP